MSTPYNRVVLQGNFFGGEEWSVSPAFNGLNGDVVSDFEDLQAWGQAIVQLNTNAIWPASLAGIASSAVHLTGVRTEYFDATNKLAQVAETPVAQATGGTGSVLAPLQCSLVVSLLSGRPGRSFNGRLYFPCLSASLSQSTARISDSEAETIATDTAQWLRSIADEAPGGVDLDPAIFSQKLGTTSTVTSVRVGNVVDTQRRRRDKQVEAYSSAPIPAT